jgi:ABC-type uncharacterized transport system auxiliary subunit
MKMQRGRFISLFLVATSVTVWCTMMGCGRRGTYYYDLNPEVAITDRDGKVILTTPDVRYVIFGNEVNDKPRLWFSLTEEAVMRYVKVQTGSRLTVMLEGRAIVSFEKKDRVGSGSYLFSIPDTTLPDGSLVSQVILKQRFEK